MRLEESILPLRLSVVPLGLLPATGACKVWSCLTPAEWFQKREAHLFTSHFQTFAGISDPTQRLCRKRLYLLWRHLFLVLWAPYDVSYAAKYCTFKITGVFQNTEKWQKWDQLQEKIPADVVSSITLLYFGWLAWIKIPGWNFEKGEKGMEEKKKNSNSGNISLRLILYLNPRL